jgi:hypothetical protein
MGISGTETDAYAYELLNPYHPEEGGSLTLVLDAPLRVGDRMRRAFPNFTQDPVSLDRVPRQLAREDTVRVVPCALRNREFHLFSHTHNPELDTGARRGGCERSSEQGHIRPLAKRHFWKPCGRPLLLAKATRALVGEDGLALAQLWWDIARDETRRGSDRLEASKLLAERGWGKAPAYAAMEEADPLGLEATEEAAAEFRAKILKLTREAEQT